MGRIFRGIISNVTSLLLALTLAIIIWAAAVREANPDAERIVNLPINVVAPEDVILLNSPAERVEVTFTGPRNSLDALDPLSFRATLDLSTLTTTGRETVEIQVTPNDEIDENISLEINPSQTVVDIDFETTRSLPVIVTVQGTLPPTHSLGEISITPEEIEVTGPQSRVDQLKEARTSILLSSSTQQTFEETLRLTVYNREDEPVGTSGGTLLFSPNQATVLTEIIENESIADVTIQVALEGLPAPGYRLLSATAVPRTILVQGPPELLDELRVIATDPVPITGLNSSSRIPVTIELPEGIERLNNNPIVADIDIDRIMTTGVFTVEPNVIGLSPEFTATIPITQMRVTLFGPLDTLDAISADDIRAELPLTDVREGTNIVVPVVSPPTIDGIEVRSFIPSIVNVVVTRTVTQTEELPESLWHTVPALVDRPLQSANALPIADLPRRYTLLRL